MIKSHAEQVAEREKNGTTPEDRLRAAKTNVDWWLHKIAEETQHAYMKNDMVSLHGDLSLFKQVIEDLAPDQVENGRIKPWPSLDQP